MDNISIIQLHKKHIRNTKEKSIVAEITIMLCNLTFAVAEGCSFKASKVYITSKCLKHLYDKKPAEEYDFILKNLIKIIKYPDRVYQNPSTKRGDISLLKTIHGETYFCTLEKDVKPTDIPEIDYVNYIATCFRLRDEEYIKNTSYYGAGRATGLHRSAFDTNFRWSNYTPQ